MLGCAVERMRAHGVSRVLLFGLPKHKDENGSSAWDSNGVVQQGIRALRAIAPELYIITDVCMCEYTSHGHCGILCGHYVDNDRTLEVLARTAVSHARAGADMVAPSDMMDGRVAAIRAASRRKRLCQHAGHGVFREIRVYLLRPVPRRRRLCSGVR